MTCVLYFKKLADEKRLKKFSPQNYNKNLDSVKLDF